MSCSECKHKKYITWECRKKHETHVVDGEKYYLSQSGEECPDFDFEYYEEAPPLRETEPKLLFFYNRIGRLAHAIEQCKDEADKNTTSIRSWAKEIILLTNIMEDLIDSKCLE